MYIYLCVFIYVCRSGTGSRETGRDLKVGKNRTCDKKSKVGTIPEIDAN